MDESFYAHHKLQVLWSQVDVVMTQPEEPASLPTVLLQHWPWPSGFSRYLLQAPFLWTLNMLELSKRNVHLRTAPRTTFNSICCGRLFICRPRGAGFRLWFGPWSNLFPIWGRCADPPAVELAGGELVCPKPVVLGNGNAWSLVDFECAKTTATWGYYLLVCPIVVVLRLISCRVLWARWARCTRNATRDPANSVLGPFLRLPRGSTQCGAWTSSGSSSVGCPETGHHYISLQCLYMIVR